MFGRPPAPQKDWSELYFYEKVHHLFDHTADFVVAHVNWWLPSVAVGMALSLFVLGGPEGPAQAAAITLPSITPVVRAPPFSSPEGQHGAAPEEEEEF